MSKINRQIIFAEYVFDPRTGKFYIHGTRQEAGTTPENGYRRIAINGRPHLASRLVWWAYHQTCKHRLDHLNGNRDDNRISNLAPRGGEGRDALDWRGYPEDRERSLAEMERWLWELQDFIPPGPRQAWPDSAPVQELPQEDAPRLTPLRAVRSLLTREQVFSNLWFHAATGKLFRKANQAPAETWSKSGRCSVRLCGATIAAHHLVFFMFFGYFPGRLWHRNGLLDDNRIENLVEPGYTFRQTTPQWPATRPHNLKYLVPGVWWGDGSWAVYAPGTKTIVGRYPSYTEAAAERLMLDQGPDVPTA